RVHVVIPGFPAPLAPPGIALDLGLSVSAPVKFDPAVPQLGLGQVTVDEVFISALGVGSIPMAKRDEVEALLKRAGQLLLERAIGDGLPVLPIPQFKLGNALAEFGVSGTVGLDEPRFDTLMGSHFMLWSD